ncbi:Glycosyl hydrolases family 35 domain containing protein [Rhypophila sp. PSN 637]
MRFIGALTVLMGSLGLTNAATGNFTWDSKTFYVNGAQHQIIGGQIDPQRVPREYWPQRLQMAKSLGLNTIFSYLYWQDIEQHQGQFDFTGRNDVAAWFKAIQDAGLKAVLRPGPYVCAERDWGGIPGWLSPVQGLKIRSNNQPFLELSAKYLAKVGEQLAPLLITNGGPILMVQIENEYGYVGNDKNYLKALSNSLSRSFPGLKQYTNDGASALKSGFLPGALAVVDGGGTENGFRTLQSSITDQSSRGPLMNGELWITWFDVWGPKKGHAGNNGNAGDVDFVLANGHHFSLFMFHGGTSWGFGNGAQDAQPIQPFTTSYDYGAVLDETGRVASNFAPFRNAIAKKVSSIPAVPSNPPLQAIASFPLTPVANWFDMLPKAVASSSPKVMEALGQVWGYVLYEHVATAAASGKVVPGNGIRDRVIVYVSGAKQGVIDGIYKTPATVNVNLSPGDKLWLLVENLGRADNGFSDQTKGIAGSVTVGGKTLTQWNHYSLPLDGAPSGLPSNAVTVKANSAPVWYRGTFANTKSGMAADTFLELPGGVKGVVFVNGHNLGRYWTIGPQQQLFVPGAWLNTTGSNEVLVLELEPGTSSRSARGLATRTWANNPDPDCPNCT